MGSGRKMNKRADGDRIFSVWWFFMLVFISGGIVIGVWIYYFAEINVNEVEADILSERIMNCFIKEGYLGGVLGEDFDVFAGCGVSESIFEKGSDFYFKISIYDGGNLMKEISEGDSSLKKDCEIGEGARAEYFPECYEKDEVVLSGGGNFKIVVLTASNQRGGRF